MTRIIAGAAGSLSLEVPASGTRPTSDRVRESIFSSLQARDAIEGATVLDLFAGSGALGLEALSRGAQHVDLVEKAPRAASVIYKNAGRVARAVASTAWAVHRTGADTFVRACSRRYDLVFLDPPYDYSEQALTATLQALRTAVATEALVIVERASRSPQPSAEGLFVVDNHRTYGDTAVWWLSPAP